MWHRCGTEPDGATADLPVAAPGADGQWDRAPGLRELGRP